MFASLRGLVVYWPSERQSEGAGVLRQRPTAFLGIEKLEGRLTSALSGLIGVSEQQRRYYAAGWRCPNCGVRLLTTFSKSEKTRYYSADGQELLMSGILAAVRADSAECPKCSYRWKTRAKSVASPHDVRILGLNETDRSEEFFGEDRRVIDNSRSATQLTRTFAFTKEWSRSCRVDLEGAQSDGIELSIGSTEAAALKVSTEESVRRTYSVMEDIKETCSEEVACQIPAHTKLTVVIQWKRIWQNGSILTSLGPTTIQIPFKVAVALTFDQQQIDDSHGTIAKTD